MGTMDTAMAEDELEGASWRGGKSNVGVSAPPAKQVVSVQHMFSEAD